MRGKVDTTSFTSSCQAHPPDPLRCPSPRAASEGLLGQSLGYKEWRNFAELAGTGERSVYRRKDGRCAGENEDANGKRRYISGKTKAEVRAKLRNQLADTHSKPESP
jgi:hypothetical protein